MDSTWMNSRPTVLSKGERDILIMAAIHPGGRHLSLSEIGQRRRVSANSVRLAMHRACVKLQARNRYEAILLAVRGGEITIGEYLSPNEVVETVGSLGPDLLRKLAQHMRQEEMHGYLPRKEETFTPTEGIHGTILTKREREVLVLVARGLPNMDIAARLYVSGAAVRVCLSRVCTKLGATNRGDAVVLALKQREISLGEMYSLPELGRMWAPLGSELIENTARLLDSNTRVGRAIAS